MSERDMRSILRRPDHAEGCKMDGCALVGECFHGEAMREVTRLREALEQVAKACICGGKGRRMYWPECRLCEDSGEDHACPERREIDCFSRQCGIARAALATATAKGG